MARIIYGNAPTVTYTVTDKALFFVSEILTNRLLEHSATQLTGIGTLYGETTRQQIAVIVSPGVPLKFVYDDYESTKSRYTHPCDDEFVLMKKDFDVLIEDHNTVVIPQWD